MSGIKIEHDIPIPKARPGKKMKYPEIKDLEPGQSFLMEGETWATGSNPVHAYACSWNRANPDNKKKFTTRTTNKGLRVWRVE